MRGIVAGPAVKSLGNGSIFIENSGIDPTKLRQYLLYWDRIEYPTNRGFNFTSKEVEFLSSTGVLQRTEIPFALLANKDGIMTQDDALLKSPQLAFNFNNAKEQGMWSMTQPNQSLHLTPELSEEHRSVEIELVDSLPLPDLSVPLEKILEFKEKRKDELGAFRSYLDSLYLEVINSKDIPRSRIKAIEDLQRGIVDLHKVMGESKIKQLVGSMKVELNVRGIIFAAGALGYLHTQYDLPLFLSVPLAASAGMLNFDVKPVMQPKKIPENLKDYAYLFYAEKEVR